MVIQYSFEALIANFKSKMCKIDPVNVWAET